MEAPDIEALAEFAAGFLAQFQNLQHAHLVGQSLTWVDQIAFDLGDDFTVAHAGVVFHVGYGLFAAPALGVHAGIHNQPHSAEHLGLQSAEIVQRLALETRLPGELLGVQGPAFRIDGESEEVAEHRQAFEFLRQ